MNMPITGFIALPLSLLMIGLAYRVAHLRVRHKIGLGTGSNKTLARAMAAHSNAVENIPLALILFALAEVQGANAVFLWTCGGIFILARLMNAVAVNQHAGNSFGRFYGIIFSWLVIIVLAACNVWQNFAA